MDQIEIFSPTYKAVIKNEGSGPSDDGAGLSSLDPFLTLEMQEEETIT